MSSSNSPCAACKFLRRKCTQECVFAPYFPPENPQRFACVHRVFGASNVAKLLNELTASQRDDAVKSLAYEAEARLRDPVYGCVGFIYVLQQRLHQIQTDLLNAKKELTSYTTPQSMQGLIHPQALQGIPLTGNPLASTLLCPSFGGNPTQLLTNVPHNTQQQELLEAQQLAIVAAAREQQQVMMKTYEQQQVMMKTYEQQQEFLRFNSGFEPTAGSIAIPVVGGGDESGGFGHQMGAHSGGGQVDMAPSLALGTFESVGGYELQQQPHNNSGEHHVGDGHHRHPVEAQLLLSPQQQHSESEDGRSVRPSS